MRVSDEWSGGVRLAGQVLVHGGEVDVARPIIFEHLIRHLALDILSSLGISSFVISKSFC